MARRKRRIDYSSASEYEDGPEGGKQVRSSGSELLFFVERVLADSGRTLRLALLLIILFAAILSIVIVVASASQQALPAGIAVFILAFLALGMMIKRTRRRSYRHVSTQSTDLAAVIEKQSTDVAAIIDKQSTVIERQSAGVAAAMSWALSQQSIINALTPSGIIGAQSSPASLGCSVYCASEKDATLVVGILDRNLREFGIVLKLDGPPIIGSWFQRFKVNSEEVISSRQFQRRLRQAEQALKNRLLEEPGAQITKSLSESVCGLLRDSKDVDDLVVHLPRLLFVKKGGAVRARVLSEAEALDLDANPHILVDPAAAMRYVKSLDSRSVMDQNASNVVANIDAWKNTSS